MALNIYPSDPKSLSDAELESCIAELNAIQPDYQYWDYDSDDNSDEAQAYQRLNALQKESFRRHPMTVEQIEATLALTAETLQVLSSTCAIIPAICCDYEDRVKTSTATIGKTFTIQRFA